MLGNFLQQTTSADDIFRCIFFLCALRVKVFFFFFSTLLQKRSQTNGEIIFELNLRQSHLNFVYNSSIGLLTVTLPDEIPAETWTHIGIQVRLPYLIQDYGNTMPDLSDLVPFHSGQVENFFLLVLGQVQMYKVSTILYFIF